MQVKFFASSSLLEIHMMHARGPLMHKRLWSIIDLVWSYVIDNWGESIEWILGFKCLKITCLGVCQRIDFKF